jgi:hypothetical protein
METLNSSTPNYCQTKRQGVPACIFLANAKTALSNLALRGLHMPVGA